MEIELIRLFCMNQAKSANNQKTLWHEYDLLPLEMSSFNAKHHYHLPPVKGKACGVNIGSCELEVTRIPLKTPGPKKGSTL